LGDEYEKGAQYISADMQPAAYSGVPVLALYRRRWNKRRYGYKGLQNSAEG
jgi:hypothetical protein